MSVGSSTNFSYIINYLYTNGYLTNDSLASIISTIYGTTEAESLLVGNYLTSEQIINLIKQLAIKDDSSLKYLIDNIGNDIYTVEGLELANKNLKCFY
ncbi:MAG: hypothetical protein L6U99_07360 [Clostridium sp.]|nr:MAG: hypothetical protein L6U99_07360 [Clostridium sp.]